MYSCSFNNYNNKNNISFGKRIPVKVFGNISKPFVNEIKTGINQYPQQVTTKLQKSGLVDDIRLAPKLSDAFPEFPSVQDYFREVESKFGQFPKGFAGELKNEKGIPFLKFISLCELPKVSGEIGNVSHELSHKADDLLKRTVGIPLSQTESFKEAVKNDLSKIKIDKSLYKKFKQITQKVVADTIQKGNPDDITSSELREIFAECGATNTTGTQSELKAKTKLMNVFFPEACKYVEKYLYLLGQR